MIFIKNVVDKEKKVFVAQSSYHLHDEVTTHKALLSRLLETRVLWVKPDTQIIMLSIAFLDTVALTDLAITSNASHFLHENMFQSCIYLQRELLVKWDQLCPFHLYIFIFELCMNYN